MSLLLRTDLEINYGAYLKQIQRGSKGLQLVTNQTSQQLKTEISRWQSTDIASAEADKMMKDEKTLGNSKEESKEGEINKDENQKKETLRIEAGDDRSLP